MLLQRKNDSRDASSRSLRRYAAPAAQVGRLALEAEQELRIDEHARQRALDAALERARLASGAIELEQASPCSAPLAAQDGDRRGSRSVVRICRRARLFVRRGRRRADEQPTAARRVAGPGGVVRTGDRDLRDARRARLDVEDAVGAAVRLRTSDAAAMVCGPAGTRIARRTASLEHDAHAVDCDDRGRRRVHRPRGGPPRRAPPACPICRSYSASSGNVWRTTMPPRVPSGSPSMCASCEDRPERDRRRDRDRSTDRRPPGG